MDFSFRSMLNFFNFKNIIVYMLLTLELTQQVQLLQNNDQNILGEFATVTPAQRLCSNDDQNCTKTKLITSLIDSNMSFVTNNVQFAKSKCGVFALSGTAVYSFNFSLPNDAWQILGYLHEVIEVVEFHVLCFEEITIAVIAAPDNFQVYLLDSGSTDDETLTPVQKVAVHGELQRVAAISTSSEHYLLITANFTKSRAKLSVYKWEKSSFHLKDEDDLKPANQLLSLSETAIPLIFAINQNYNNSKVSIETFKIDKDELQKGQHLYINASVILPFVLKDEAYMLACDHVESSCSNYAIVDGEFAKYSQVALPSAITDAVYGGDFILARNIKGEYMVTTDMTLKEFSVFKLNDTDVPDVTIFSTKSELNLIFLVYIKSSTISVRIMKIEWTPKDVSDSTSSSVSALDENLQKLRQILLSRRSMLNSLKEYVETAKQLGILDEKPSIKIESGYVENVRVVSKDFDSFPVLISRLETVAKKLNSLLRKIRKSRSTVFINVQSLRVRDLKYNGTLFEGIQKSPLRKDTLVITTPKVVIKSADIGSLRIPLNEKRSSNNESRINTIIENISLEKINGIHWDSFYNDIFIKTRDKKIDGNLVFSNSLRVKDLNVDILDNKKVRNLFTLTTDQDIHSKILISNCDMHSLQTNQLNGIQFGKDTALLGADNLIQGPTVIKWLTAHNLTLTADDQSDFVRRIFRAENTERLQIYTKKVTIDGTLTLNDIQLNTPRKQITVANRKMSFNPVEQYWTKSFNQEFHTVTFEQSVSMPRLNAVHLNGQLFSDILLRTANHAQNTFMVFNTSTLLGDVLIKNKDVTSVLKQLSDNVVRKGESVTIQGFKEFTEGISVKHLITESVNNTPIKDIVPRNSSSVSFTGAKRIPQMFVENTFSVNDLKVGDLNGHNLTSFFSTAIKRDQTLTIDKLVLLQKSNFKSIFSENYTNLNVSSMIECFEALNRNTSIQRDMKVDGDVTFAGGLHVKLINNIEWEVYRNLLVLVDEKAQIGGSKKFANSLTVRDIANIHTVNGLNLTKFLENCLAKNRDQIILSDWDFGRIRIAGNLFANTINNIGADLVMTPDSSEVQINSDLLLKDATIHGSMFGNVNLDFSELEEKLTNFHNTHFEYIEILNDVQWPIANSSLEYLLKNAVRKDTDQVITGDIIFTEDVYFTAVDRSDLIGGINISEIYSDSLLKHSEQNQYILAEKNFMGAVQFDEVFAGSYLGAEVVNNIDILGFNASMFRLTDQEAISTRKIFHKPPFIKFLNVYGNVNNMNIDNIFFSSYDDILPPIYISNLIVENELHVERINSVNFDQFIHSRVRKFGAPQEIFGYLTFERLVLKNDVTLTSINNIQISDIVLQNSTTLQEISGSKTIWGTVFLFGPAHVIKLNDVDVIGKRAQSVFLNENCDLEYLSVTSATFNNGTFGVQFLNGQHIDDYLGWDQKLYANISSEIDRLDSSVSEIQQKVDELNLQRRFLYMEYDYLKGDNWERSFNTSIIQKDLSKKCLSCKAQCFEEVLTLSSTLQNVKIIGSNGEDLKISNLTIFWKSNSDEQLHKKDFTFEYPIVKLEQFGMHHNESSFAVIQFVSDTLGTAIVLIKVDVFENTIRPVQSFKDFKSTCVDLQLFNIHDQTFAVISANSSVVVYEFNFEREYFHPIQNITGSYNILQIVQIRANSHHLILSCKSCEHISIYELTIQSPTTTPDLYLFQNLRIEARVKDLYKLISSSGIFLIILAEHDENLYHFYKYQDVEGWKHLTYGKFANIENIVPLIAESQDFVLLTSKNNSAIVAVHSQG